MADITGPISTLPGTAHVLPAGVMCDVHQDRPATSRIQGETDSFGSEVHDLCKECADAMRASVRAPYFGVCDWCKSEADDLRPHRDFEEGSSGPVYDVCLACRKREVERLEDELY